MKTGTNILLMASGDTANAMQDDSCQDRQPSLTSSQQNAADSSGKEYPSTVSGEGKGMDAGWGYGQG